MNGAYAIVSITTLAAGFVLGDPAIWAQWGLAGLVVFYTLARDHYREKRMNEAMEADHKWIRDTLLTALDRNTEALTRVSR